MIRVFNPHLDAVDIVHRFGVLSVWLAVAWVQLWAANQGPVDWRPIRVAVGSLAVITCMFQLWLLFTDIDPRVWAQWATGLNYPTAIVAGIGTAVFSVNRWRAFQHDLNRDS